MIEMHPITSVREWSWFKERTHVIRCEDTQGICAYMDGNLAAMAVFDSFTVDSCSVHLAIDNPMVLRHGFLEAIAYHAYIVCGRTRLFGLVPDNNKRALKLDKHIGFKEVARIPHAVSENVGYIVMELHRRDCRFLPEEVREAA
jgi:L-amino acid N-acyltransferase YncA